jgi:hypothetical protein
LGVDDDPEWEGVVSHTAPLDRLAANDRIVPVESV